MTTRTSAGSTAQAGQGSLTRRFVAILAGWVGLTTVANLTLPGSPGDAWFVLVVIAALVLPPAVFLVGYARCRPFRELLLRLDFSAITAVQGMRIAGIAMLSLWAVGAMTPVFALWAGGIDVFIGMTAVPIAYLVANRTPVPRAFLRIWHGLGLLDFVVAVPLGIALTTSSRGAVDGPSTDAIFAFPLSFIPMVGVPFTIIMHCIAVFQLAAGRTPTSGALVHSAGRPAAVSGNA